MIAPVSRSPFTMLDRPVITRWQVLVRDTTDSIHVSMINTTSTRGKKHVPLNVLLVDALVLRAQPALERVCWENLQVS